MTAVDQARKDDNHPLGLQLEARIILHPAITGYELTAVQYLAWALLLQLLQDPLCVTGLLRPQLVSVQESKGIKHGRSLPRLDAAGYPPDRVLGSLRPVLVGDQHRE